MLNKSKKDRKLNYYEKSQELQQNSPTEWLTGKMLGAEQILDLCEPLTLVLSKVNSTLLAASCPWLGPHPEECLYLHLDPRQSSRPCSRTTGPHNVPPGVLRDTRHILDSDFMIQILSLYIWIWKSSLKNNCLYHRHLLRRWDYCNRPLWLLSSVWCHRHL